MPAKASAHEDRTAGAHTAAAPTSRAGPAITAAGEAVGERQVLHRDVAAVCKENTVVAGTADGDVICAAVDCDIAVKQRQSLA
jgi:hypothetical protein